MLALALVGAIHPAFSQSEDEEQEQSVGAQLDIIAEIENASNGNVEIIISDDILEQVLSNVDEPRKGSGNVRHASHNAGYRIQVFSDGRNQSTLESRAKARGKAIANRFPEFRGQIYTFSSAPNWYTRVGNFRTQAEANEALEELKRAFPRFSSEMRVVRSKIVLR